MTGDRAYRPRGRWRNFRLTSHRLGIILIVLSLVWGMYLIQLQLNDKRSQSEYLKQKIIALSKEYIDAIAKEKGLYPTGLGDSDNGKRIKLMTDFLYFASSIALELCTNSFNFPVFWSLQCSSVTMLLYLFNLYRFLFPKCCRIFVHLYSELNYDACDIQSEC